MLLRATEPVLHNYWACILEPVLLNRETLQWEAWAPPLARIPHLPQLEKAHVAPKTQHKQQKRQSGILVKAAK